jgi:uncharacterized membrane protein
MTDPDAGAADEDETDDSAGRRERIERGVKVVLLVVLVVSLVGVVYVAIDPPRATDPYSEFYLLGPDGIADDYPTRLQPGESGTVIVGVTNHEGSPTTYHVRVVDTNASGDGTLATASQTVSPDETWETDVTFSIEETGRHRVQFQLYKEQPSGEPYLTTRLWVNVTTVVRTPVPTPTNTTNSTSRVAAPVSHLDTAATVRRGVLG